MSKGRELMRENKGVAESSGPLSAPTTPLGLIVLFPGPHVLLASGYLLGPLRHFFNLKKYCCKALSRCI